MAKARNIKHCFASPIFDINVNQATLLANKGIDDEASFYSFLLTTGATDIFINDFLLENNRLYCELRFDNWTGYDFFDFGITGINNLSALKNFTSLGFSINQITSIKNLNQLTKLQDLNFQVNQISTINDISYLKQLLLLNIENNQLTTSDFNNLNDWALIAPENGNIYTGGNIDDFNTSTTYTTLLAKNWTIIN
jgi:hypothetical protein